MNTLARSPRSLTSRLPFFFLCSSICCALAASSTQKALVAGSSVAMNMAGDSPTTMLDAIDLNADGRPDLLGLTLNGPAVWLNNGTSTPFQGVTGTVLAGRWAYVVDLNNDGRPDIVCVIESSTATVYLNNGTGAPFDSVSAIPISAGSNPTAAAFGDVDGDGFPDMVVNVSGGPLNTPPFQKLYLSGGHSLSDGSQTPKDLVVPDPYGFLGANVKLADVNGDGRVDLLMAEIGGADVYLNNGTATPFTGVTPLHITQSTFVDGIVVGDMNGDGKQDVLVLGGVSARLSGVQLPLFQELYINTGSATQPFAQPKTLPFGRAGGGCVAGRVLDLNADGLPDLLLGCVAYSPYDEPATNPSLPFRASGEMYLNDGTPEAFTQGRPYDISAKVLPTGGTTVVADLTGNHTLDLVKDGKYWPLMSNSIPVAADDSVLAGSGLVRTTNVLANDTDADGTLNPASIEITKSPAHGTLTNDGTQLTYQSQAGYSGTDSFAYTVADNLGTASNVAQVAVAVQSPPVANDDTATTTAGNSISVNVLANDTSQGGTLDAATVTITTGPTHGTAQMGAGGAIVYQPASGYTGADTFKYSAKDNAGSTSNVATVTMSIQAAPSRGGGGAMDVLSLIVLGGAGGLLATLRTSRRLARTAESP